MKMARRCRVRPAEIAEEKRATRRRSCALLRTRSRREKFPELIKASHPKMLKLLGIVLFCGLLTPVQGPDPGASFLVSRGEIVNFVAETLVKNGLLLENLKAIKIPDIVREGSLLSALLKITGLHIVDMQLPVVSLELLPSAECRVRVYSKLEIQGDYLFGAVPDPIDIFAAVNITVKLRIADYSSGTYQVVFEDCHFVLVSIDISLLSGLLPVSVNNLVSSTLRNTLPSLLCPVLYAVFNFVKTHAESTMNMVLQVGAVGSIEYQLASLPLLFEQHTRLDLSTLVQPAEGGSVAPAAGSAPAALPPLRGNVLNLGLTEAFLNTALPMLAQIQRQVFAFSPDVVSEAPQLTDAILALIPPGCSRCPVSTPLSIVITEAGAPVIALEANKATVKLPVRILVFTNLADGTVLTVLALEADLALNADISVSDDHLLIEASLDSVALVLESSDVGIVHVSDLVRPMHNLLEEAYVPPLNEALRVGIPLPKLMNIDFTGAVVQSLEDLLVLYV
ncbi:BPI fold containing family B, member 3 precursor isoform B [Alligator mississippiensis]|uniref:BPI fold containing family B, member 3 isoform B n=2 Tax=Alligator mississippiensis TaxID=8496 RepID=A0A151MI51_ALLMI|nr:BPI fold containing family B, member 3 precursor isoform B [Alligator mississippiensis]